MARFLSILLLLVLGVGVLGGVLWNLAYREGTPPARTALPGLTDSARVTWGPEGTISVEAETEADAAAALGFAHGWQHTWSIVLWRQAALGELGQWFGDPAFPLDSLVHVLRIPSGARAAYHGLDDPDRAWIDGYSRGLSLALSKQPPRLQQELTLLDVTPDAWEPWHTLAVERLFSWLATSPPAPPDSLAPPARLDSLRMADQALHAWLQLYGFEHGIAWAARDSVSTHLFVRHNYGASALPFLTRTRLRWSGGPDVLGASVPGTPFFPVGRTGASMWTVLWSAPADAVRSQDPSPGSTKYYRIDLADGAEHLVTSRYIQGRLLLDDAAPSARTPVPAPAPAQTPPRTDTTAVPSDSVLHAPAPSWSLYWSGLAHGTDVPAWRALFRGETASFRLIRGDGLRLTRDGQWSEQGNPQVSLSFSGGHFISNSPWAEHAAERLQQLRTDSTRILPAAWSRDVMSPWAEQLAPSMLNTLAMPETPTPPLEEALTYLLNWDFSYDRPSIGASIFEAWLTTYRAEVGDLPTPQTLPEDTLIAERRILTATLLRAIESLTDAYGDDMSRWRWERVQPDRWRFPLWTDEHPASATLPARQRFAPIDLPGQGHPSTLNWGSSPILDAPSGPATWSAWIQTSAWGRLSVRHRRMDPDAPLDRYLASHGVPPVVQLTDDAPAGTTTLLVPPPAQ